MDVSPEHNLKQASSTKPTIEETNKWDNDKLLEWIQQRLPKLLKGGILEKFKTAHIRGDVFLNHAGDVEFFENTCNLPFEISWELAYLSWEIAGGETAGIKGKLLSLIPCVPGRRQANNLTGLSKVDAKEAFKAGIKYTPPGPLVHSSGADWAYQPHPDQYEILATSVLESYNSYKSNNIDKTYLPTYFYVGGAGTGKSRHASEFACSVQNAITFRTQHPLHPELWQRLKRGFVFHVSFEGKTPLTEEEMSNPWNAIGVRMLHQLLGKPIDYIRSRYVADPGAVFRLVAAAENVDPYDDLTGILVVDAIHKTLIGSDDGNDKNSAFYRLLDQIGGLSLTRRHHSETKGAAPFIMTCVTSTSFLAIRDFLTSSNRPHVYLPINKLSAPTWKHGCGPASRRVG